MTNEWKIDYALGILPKTGAWKSIWELPAGAGEPLREAEKRGYVSYTVGHGPTGSLYGYSLTESGKRRVLEAEERAARDCPGAPFVAAPNPCLEFCRRVEEHLWELLKQGALCLPVIEPHIAPIEAWEKPYTVTIEPKIIRYVKITEEERIRLLGAREKRR